LNLQTKHLIFSRTVIIAAVLTIILILAPFLVSSYVARVIFLLFAYVAFAECFDTLSGYTGYVNLGHGAFFAAGAYAFTILASRGIPLIIAALSAGVVALLLGVGASYPFFRLSGAYFSIATYGLIVLLFQITTNLSWLTGGTIGMSLTIPSTNVALPAYYAGLALVLGTILTNILISRSRFGLALISIREDESTSEHFGIRIFRNKQMAMMISAFWAGLVGSVYIFNIGYINPSSILGLDIALAPVIMAMLGGSGTPFGPAVGASILIVLQEILWTKTSYLHLAMYGVIYLLIGIFMPRGILGSKRIKFFLIKRLG
jgi:branched-chain amino acid transport system permease protein